MRKSLSYKPTAEVENPFLTFSVAVDEEEKPPPSPRFIEEEEDLDIPDEECKKIGTPECKPGQCLESRKLPSTPGSSSVTKRVLEKGENVFKKLNPIQQTKSCTPRVSKFQTEETKSTEGSKQDLAGDLSSLPLPKLELAENSPRAGILPAEAKPNNKEKIANTRKFLQGFE